LLYAEQRGACGVLACVSVCVPAASVLAHRQLPPSGKLVSWAIRSRTFVERHDNVGPQKTLNLHRTLGREHVLRSVEMTAELHPVFAKLTELGQAHDLITAAIGEDRPIPIHELVQSAKASDAFRPRSQH